MSFERQIKSFAPVGFALSLIGLGLGVCLLGAMFMYPPGYRDAAASTVPVGPDPVSAPPAPRAPESFTAARPPHANPPAPASAPLDPRLFDDEDEIATWRIFCLDRDLGHVPGDSLQIDGYPFMENGNIVFHERGRRYMDGRREDQSITNHLKGRIKTIVTPGGCVVTRQSPNAPPVPEPAAAP